jgi:uncharacterized protein (DUF4415 family)
MTNKKKRKTTGTDWEYLKRQGEGKEPIDFSDIPDLADAFWQNAAIIMPGGKTKLTIRIDTDVYEWFVAKGTGYQTRMNAVLRSYMREKEAMSGQRTGHAAKVVREGRGKYSTKRTANTLASQLAELLTFCEKHPEPSALSDALKQYDRRRSKQK